MADLGDRTKYIGGSDIAAIRGISRWRTRLEVWAFKVGITPPVKSNIAMDLGTELEDYVAKRFTKETGKAVRRVNKAFTDKEKPYLKGHIDRDVVGEDAILECKTCSAFMAKAWEGEEIPADYILQVYFYLMLTGASKAYIAVLIGNHDFKIKEINRTPDVEKAIADIRECAIDFWENYVMTNVMPVDFVAGDKDVLSQIFPVNKIPKMVELPSELTSNLEEMQSADKDIKTLSARIEQLKNEVRAAIGDNDGGICGTWEVSWKAQGTAGKFDKEKFDKDYPGVYSKYVTKGVTRVFRYKNKLEKDEE